MSDYISRADAIEAACNEMDWLDDGYVEERKTIIKDALSALPSADAVPWSVADKIGEDRERLEERVSELEERLEWIPVSERLPETHTEYVTENPWMQVTVGEDTYQLSDAVLGYGRRKHHSKDDPMMSVVWYEDDGEGRTAWQTAPDCEDIEVIAWMPLPKPYREDGE